MGKRRSAEVLNLGKEEIEELRRLRVEAKRTGNFGLDRRARAILAIGVDGVSQVEAARLCEVWQSTVSTWVKRYLSQGADGLRDKPRPGKRPRLSDAQIRELCKAVEAGPEACGFDSGVWTSPMLAKWVWRRFGVRLSARRIRAILNQAGYSVQYPRRRLSRASQEEQERWLKEEYPKIKKKAVRKGANCFSRMKLSSSKAGHYIEHGQSGG